MPINNLVQVEGTPLHGTDPLDPFEFVRTIAVARITMPTARVRLSAGRRQMGEAMQALCFLAGANSIFYGDKLLTTGNPDVDADHALFAKLGLVPFDRAAARVRRRDLPSRAIARTAPRRRAQSGIAARWTPRRGRASSSTDGRCWRSRATTISVSPAIPRSRPRCATVSIGGASAPARRI